MAQARLPLRKRSKKAVKVPKRAPKPKAKPGKVAVRAHYRSKPKG